MSLSLQHSYLTDIKGAHSKAGNLRLTSHLREDKKRGGVGREGMGCVKRSLRKSWSDLVAGPASVVTVSGQNDGKQDSAFSADFYASVGQLTAPWYGLSLAGGTDTTLAQEIIFGEKGSRRGLWYTRDTCDKGLLLHKLHRHPPAGVARVSRGPTLGWAALPEPTVLIKQNPR